MDIIKKKMTSWLKVFAIIFNIIAILDGIGVVFGVFGFILFACNKNLYTYDIGNSKTIADLFNEMGIASLKELLGILGASIISIALSLVMFILLVKWFKSAHQTGEPFSTNLIQFLRKIAKYMISASISGWLAESIILTAVDSSFSTSYQTMFWGGLLAMCLSYVLAYANVSRKVEIETEQPAQQNHETPADNKEQ